jgi:hypothetical protein
VWLDECLGRLEAGSLKMMTKMEMLCAFFEKIDVVAE